MADLYLNGLAVFDFKSFSINGMLGNRVAVRPGPYAIGREKTHNNNWLVMGSGGRSCIENGVIEIKRRGEEKGAFG